MAVATTTERIPKLGYQPSLDGLRAISVLAVIFYHANVSWLPGGFLGVEVFFVISGFLITSLLIEERHKSGRIDLRAFWIRRARRLLPALYLLLGVVSAAALLVYHDAAGRMGGDVLAALAYVSNWWNIFLKESYFAQTGRPPLLRHLWSLAVEEQFYLIFPPLFAFAISRFARNRVRTALIVISIASATLMALLYTPYSDPSRVYYGTDTRLAGMLVGAVLAMSWSPWRSRVKADPGAGRVLDVAGVLGFLALAWFLTNVNEFDPFIYRGGFLLLDVVCIVIIAVLVHPDARLSRVLEFPLLVWIGLRSYAIYLWHWPIFQVTRPELDLPLKGLPLFILRMALTIGAAEISYRYVEQPLRKGAIGNWWRKVRTSEATDRAVYMRQGMLFGGCFAVAVILLAAGLGNASSSSNRQKLEIAAMKAPSLDTSEQVDAPSETTTKPQSTDDAPTAVPAAGQATSSTTTVAPVVPTTEAPVDGAQLVAVGDSVMLGASDAIKTAMPGIRIDAKVGRQFKQVADVVAWYNKESLIPGTLIVHAGTNGVFSDADLDRLIASAGDRKILLINAKVARPWEGLVNERLAAAAKRHPNAVLLDWNALSSQHPEWFANDGAHLRPDGTAAFANLIRSNL